MSNARGIPCSLPFLFSLLTLVAPAFGADAPAGSVPPPVESENLVRAIRPNGDTVVGVIDMASDMDRIPFRAVPGARLAFTVEATKGSALLPSVVFLGADRREDLAATAAMKATKGGRAVSLRDFLCDAFGLRYLEIRGAGGTTGGWTLRMQVKSPKSASGAGELAGGATAEFRFTAPGSAEGTITVKADRGSAARPSFAGLEGPDGAPILVDQLRQGASGFTALHVRLDLPGEYVFRVSSPAGAAGGFRVSARWKEHRLPSRTLDEATVVADPVITSLEPAGGITSESFQATLEADFAMPSASVVFRSGGSRITIPPAAVAVAGTTVSFWVDLVGFQAVTYDVSLVNPDGGAGLLPRSFAVGNTQAAPVSVEPAFGYDNETARVTVSGSWLLASSTVQLVRGGAVIPGTSVTGNASAIAVSFDLYGRARGAWDLSVQNAGTGAATLAAAFEVRKPLPVVTFVGPSHNFGGFVVIAGISGQRFEPGSSVFLRRGGETIDATDVLVTGFTSITATFDTTGATPGAWDVVVRLPDGPEGFLPGGFRVGGPVAAASAVLAANDLADGPPTVLRNPDRGEYLLAWIESDAGESYWRVKAIRMADDGSALGGAVVVSTSGAPVPKRDLAAAYDSGSGQYLLVWAEVRNVTPSGSGHPTGEYAQDLWEVFARRLAAANLAAAADPVQVTDHSSDGTWSLDEFDNTRPSVASDGTAGAFAVAWMRAYSVKGLGGGSYDDYDVLLRTLAPADDALGALQTVAASAWHEGDPCLAWDATAGRLLVAFNARAASDLDPLDVHLGTPGQTGLVAAGVTDDLADPQIAVDGNNGRVLLSWTRVPGAGARSVEAVLVSGTDLATTVGSSVSFAASDGDTLLARPAWSAAAGEGYLTWTELSSLGDASVRMQRLDTSRASALVTLGEVIETSTGSGDEAVGAVLAAPDVDEVAVLWLKGLSSGSLAYPQGSVFPAGPVRGAEVWLQRMR